VGKKKALAMAVKNHLGRRRYTKLAEWLAPEQHPLGANRYGSG
jgi:hypothetical protein